MYEFTQIHNDVLNSTPEVKIPEWIENIDFQKPEKTASLNISPDYSIINQKHVIANRNENTAYSRDIKMSFNDKMLCNYAKTKLATVLTGKNYQISDCKIHDNQVELKVNFEKNPANYTFTYSDCNGKVQPGKTFVAELNNSEQEYPFSLAGLEDSFEDVENGFDKTATTFVIAPNDYTIMSRYEIVQRCNNSIQKASEAINKQLKEGNIVGVGSNEYASIYDMNYLFPDLRKPFEGEKLRTAEFIDNRVSTNINEKKTAKRLGLEAVKDMRKDFKVEELIKSYRNEDDLFVTAKISNHGITYTPVFSYKIENEKAICDKVIIGNNAYTYSDFCNHIKEASSNISKKTANCDSFAKAYIDSYRNLSSKLEEVVSKEVAAKLIQYWKKTAMIRSLDSVRYSSKHSFNDLLDKTQDVSYLSDAELKDILASKKKFGEDSKFYQVLVKDNASRTNQILDRKASREDAIKSLIKAHNGNNIYISNDYVSFDLNGKQIIAKYKDNDLKCLIKNKEISIKDLTPNGKLLEAFLNDHQESQGRRIIITSQMFYDKLHDYISKSEISAVIGYLEDNHKINKIEKNVYTSEYDFDDLIKEIDIVPNENIKKANLENANRLKKAFELYHLEDNDTRNVDLLDKRHAVIAHINYYLDKFFDNYKIQYITDKDINIKFNNKSFYTSLTYRDDKIVSASCKIGKRMIPIEKIHDAFKQNALLKQYLSNNKENQRYDIIITAKAFENKLHDYLNQEDIHNLIDSLIDKNLLIEIGTNKYASQFSFDDLIRDIDTLNPELRSQHLALAKRLEEAVSRYDVQDSDIRFAEKKLQLSDWKQFVEKPISDTIKVDSIITASLTENQAQAELKLFNELLGVHSIVTAKSNIHDNKFSSIEYFVNGKQIKPEDTFIINSLAKKASQLAKQSNYTTIFSKLDLQKKLAFLTDTSKIDEALEKWESSNMISNIGKDKYASKSTLVELIASSNLKPYTEEKIQDNYKHANRLNAIIPKSYHTNNFEAKMVSSIKDGKTHDELDALKEKTIQLAQSYVDKKILTASRFEQIKTLIHQATSTSQLDLAYKKLERYNR